MSDDKKNRVFISYSRKDLASVEKLQEYLSARGIDVWYDRSLLSGDKFRDEIRRQISVADTVLFMVSPESIKSPWVRDEILRAHRQGKLIPVQVGDGGAIAAQPKDLAASLPEPLSNYKILPFDVQKILTAIKASALSLKDAATSLLVGVQLQVPPIAGKLRPERIRAAIRRSKRQLALDPARTQAEIFAKLAMLVPSGEHVRKLPRGPLFDLDDIAELSSIADLVERQGGLP